MQTAPPGCHHDVLQEHAVIEQGAAAHDLVDGEHQAHRRVKKAKVALVLGVHFVFFTFDNAQQTIQAPAVFAPPINIGADPFFRVVVVGFLVVGGFFRVVAQVVVRSAHFLHQAVAVGTLQDIHLPRLGVGARWGPARHLQNGFDGGARHRLVRESAHGHAAGDGLVHGLAAFAGGHVKVSNNCLRGCAKLTGRRLTRSTYTCTKCPRAAHRSWSWANKATS